MCKYELPTSRLSKVIVLQTHRQTDTTEIIRHAATRVVKNYVGVEQHGNLPLFCNFHLHVRYSSSLSWYLYCSMILQPV